MSQKPTAPERAYPGIEVFLETQDRSSIAERFAATKEALAGLPKPKADAGKRALAAIAHAEGLLGQLFDVKEKMSADGGSKKARR
jgi:hypothetical protein